MEKVLLFWIYVVPFFKGREINLLLCCSLFRKFSGYVKCMPCNNKWGFNPNYYVFYHYLTANNASLVERLSLFSERAAYAIVKYQFIKIIFLIFLRYYGQKLLRARPLTGGTFSSVSFFSSLQPGPFVWWACQLPTYHLSGLKKLNRISAIFHAKTLLRWWWYHLHPSS